MLRFNRLSIKSETYNEGGSIRYSKCPKISNTKVTDKMSYANNEDPDQTAPGGSTLFAIPLSIL